MTETAEVAPAFRGIRQDGATFDTASLTDRPYVLFFYPKAGSLGCNREAKGFVELAPHLNAAGISIVGVSVDRPDAQQRFAEDCRVPFPLVADPDRAIARQFGVLGAFGVARRVTFLVGADGTVLETVHSALPGEHVRRTRARFLASDRGEEAAPVTSANHVDPPGGDGGKS